MITKDNILIALGFFMLSCLTASADTKQKVTISGTASADSVKQITFSGDNVVLTLGSGTTTTQTVDMEAVNVAMEYIVPVSIGSTGWRTFSYPQATNFKETGATVYAAVVSDSKANLTAISDGIVPAGEGVLVSATASTNLEPALLIGNYTLSANNDLIGTSDSTYTTTQSYYTYILGYKNNVLAFYPMTANTTLSAYKAYFNISQSSESKLSLSFDDDATGISEIAYEGGLDTDAPMYNIMGVRVSSSYKGVVIQNGKKYVIK